MKDKEKAEVLAQILTRSEVFITDYQKRLALGETSKEQEIAMLKEMFQHGLDIIREGRQLGVSVGKNYKIQHLSLLAAINHLESKDFELPDSL
jgi:hypothetical protein